MCGVVNHVCVSIDSHGPSATPLLATQRPSCKRGKWAKGTACLRPAPCGLFPLFHFARRALASDIHHVFSCPKALGPWAGIPQQLLVCMCTWWWWPCVCAWHAISRMWVLKSTIWALRRVVPAVCGAAWCCGLRSSRPAAVTTGVGATKHSPLPHNSAATTARYGGTRWCCEACTRLCCEIGACCQIGMRWCRVVRDALRLHTMMLPGGHETVLRDLAEMVLWHQCCNERGVGRNLQRHTDHTRTAHTDTKR